MKNRLVSLMAVLLFAGIPVFAQMKDDGAMGKKPAAENVENQEKSLYTRLGGYDALAAVTDDFLGRLVKDKKLGRFFVGFSTDSQKKVRQHLVDFLCIATGGPCAYTGRDMKTSHAGIGITEEDWDISIEHLVTTLDKFKVPEKEKSEVLSALGGLKKDTVEKEK